MATLIANAATTQNLTGAATFAAAEAGALAAVLNRNTTTAIAAATTVTSATFTVTNAKVIDAVLLWLKVTAASPTGTFKVDLQKGGVSQASVTVNKADLPDSTNAIACPVLFKLTSTATGDGAATWTIVITTTGTGTVTINIASATTTNYTRALRTTTAATAAAGDDLYIVGELTGAGTNTSRTVTMNSTAATAYGNGSVNSTTVSGGLCAVSCYGTLAYGTTASTAYILRLAADLIVYQFGTLNIGSSGAEIPRNSTAVLEFQPVSADGDFGLRRLDNSVSTIAGLSRTSGKNVVKCKLTSDVASSSVVSSGPTVVSATNTATNALGADGGSLLASSIVDTAAASTHSVAYSGPSITNTTQTATVWLARGSGTNNRFVRVTMGNNTSQASVTNGFFSDIDLQAGTAGTVTAVGTGTATSVSITAVGGGFLIRMTGKVASGAATPSLILNSAAVSGTMSYTGAANQAFIYDHVAIVTASSVADTTFNVDADTGWLSGDSVCVASTSLAATECEAYPLNANAGASSLVSGLYPFSGQLIASGTRSHSGTSPTQAEVGLLTRNVKIRSTSPTLMSYVYCAALATVTDSWVEFYYVGSNTANKRGVEVDGGAATNAKSFTFCSIHDCDVWGFYCNATTVTSLNVTFSNNVIWNNYSSVGMTIIGSVTNTDWTFDSNLVMRVNNTGIYLADIGGVCTNNTVVGAVSTSPGFNIVENTLGPVLIGTFDSNTAHSCGAGLLVTTDMLSGTISNTVCWRNTGDGIQIPVNISSMADLIYNNVTLFGNNTNLGISGGDVLTITGTSIIAGDTTVASPLGIALVSAGACTFNISGVDMSGVGGIFAPHTVNDINTGGSYTNIRGTANNCKFGATNVLSTKSVWGKGAYLGFEKYNQVSGDHRTEMAFGQLKTDTSIFNTASPSMRMTPNSASSKLESAPKGKGFVVSVVNGGSVTVSVYIRKSVVGDGAAYNGNQPRLMQRANPALGQSVDVVLATYSASAGSFNQLTATSSVATDDGAWEFYVDGDGTAGWINTDDWVGGQAIASQKYWFNGLPTIDMPSAGGTSRARAYAGL